MFNESTKVIGTVRLQEVRGITSLDRMKLKYLSNSYLGQFLLSYFPARYLVLQDTGFQKNLVTNGGKALITALLGNIGGQVAPSYLAVGTSATAAAVTDTTLGAEIVDTGLQRSVATVTRTTTSVTNDTLTFNYTWTATGTKVVAEVGILNNSSGGILVGHLILGSSLTTSNGNSLIGTYNIQFT